MIYASRSSAYIILQYTYSAYLFSTVLFRISGMKVRLHQFKFAAETQLYSQSPASITICQTQKSVKIITNALLNPI